MTAYLSGITYRHDGYLLMPDHPDREMDVPFVLKSVQQLWLKFHPHLDAVDFEFDVSLQQDLPPLEKLKRCSDLSSKLIPVIEDIDRMRDCERFLSRKQRDEREQRIRDSERTSKGKVQSLEREQEARLKTKEEQDSSSVTDYTDATVRVVKTLNSIRLVYPILINMLTHEFQTDKELVIGKQSIAGSKTKKRWLLGDYVFDLGSTKNLSTIKEMMSHVIHSILPEDEVSQIMKGKYEWKNFGKQCMAQSDIPEAAQNPLKLLTLTDDLLSKAREHDEALMDYIGEGRKDEAQYTFRRAVDNLKQKLDYVLGRRFTGCRLEVYGSCLSELSIGKASDVDVSIHIPLLKNAKIKFEEGNLDAAKYGSELKSFVFRVAGALKDGGRNFFDIQAVARARVPVVKGCFRFAENPHTQDGSLCFDICFFNDIAVRNSTLLRDYTAVDPRSKNLMLAVKKWAKENNVCSAADERLSSYAWVILVIFYLQQIGLLPNLQCEELMKTTGFKIDLSRDSLHGINALNTAFVPWHLVKSSNAWQQPDDLKDIPVSVLLYGFFNFLSNFPSSYFAVSIRMQSAFIPKSAARKCSLSFLSIEDPFETFISHCPHDLAAPVSWKGEIEITQLLAQGEQYTRSVLLEEVEVEVGELWHRSEEVEEKHQNGKDSANRQPQHQRRPAQGTNRQSWNHQPPQGNNKQLQNATKSTNKLAQSQQHPERSNKEAPNQQHSRGANRQPKIHGRPGTASRQPQNEEDANMVDVDDIEDSDLKEDIVGENITMKGKVYQAGKQHNGSRKQQEQNQNRSRNNKGNNFKRSDQPGTNGQPNGKAASATENAKKSGKKLYRGKPKKSGNKQ